MSSTAKVKAWRDANREEYNAYCATYREANRERINEAARRSFAKRAPIKKLIASAKYRAKTKGLPFDLTYDLAIPDVCPACDQPMNKPTLDQVLPGRGYTMRNTRCICHECNRLKSDATAARLRQLADYIDRESQ